MQITDRQITHAVQILQAGGIIIYPTDTAFGIGCAINNEKAVKKLFKIRRRPETQAVPVLVSSIEMAMSFLQPVSNSVECLMKTYWPGALTIIYKCQTEKVPRLVRGGRDTLGVRMPKYPAIIQIINQVDVPVLGPSANFHKEKTPYLQSDLNPQLTRQVDLVLSGTSLVKQESTVVDCSVTPWKILRQGSVSLNLRL